MDIMIASTLQILGVLFAFPAILLLSAVIEPRWLKLPAAFTQKLVDSWRLILGLSIAGDIAYTAGLVVEDHVFIAAGFGVVSLLASAGLACLCPMMQWELDRRACDSAGMFYCRDCVEIHHIDAGCYGDSEEAHG